LDFQYDVENRFLRKDNGNGTESLSAGKFWASWCSLSFAGGRIVLMEADVKPMTLGSKQNAIGRWRYRAKNYKTL